MSLILIVGPMKSGKSLELIAQMSIFKHSKLRPIIVQSKLNVREENIRSRTGAKMGAIKVGSLSEIDGDKFDVIGIDEAFMFPKSDVKVVKRWLLDGKRVIVSTLDMSAMGRYLEFVRELYRLKPDEIILKTAVCESCQSLGAQFTQIQKDGKPVKRGLPDVVPEDGTYEYRPVCRECFYN